MAKIQNMRLKLMKISGCYWFIQDTSAISYIYRYRSMVRTFFYLKSLGKRVLVISFTLQTEERHGWTTTTYDEIKLIKSRKGK